MIWGIILAAGESKRMGWPKLLLPFGEKTVIETVIENSIVSKVEEILVVLGSDAEKITEKIKDYPVQISVNSHFREGMLSSIQCGFEALPEKAHAALVILGDQPSIPHSVIDRLIDAYEQTGKGIVLPAYRRKRGHPILVDMRYRDEVRRLSSDIGLRALIHSHTEDIREIEVHTPSILSDIDTVDDYNEQMKHRRQM
jgi:molybdenum cofactor cytidylyltransferase